MEHTYQLVVVVALLEMAGRRLLLVGLVALALVLQHQHHCEHQVLQELLGKVTLVAMALLPTEASMPRAVVVAASGALAGDGGAGAIFYLGTTRYAVGGGGGGGVTVNGTKGDATDGGGNGGAKGAAAAAATANTGGGGGGGGTAGGNGGTGLVVVCFETGSMTVSATGTYSTSTATINGIGYTFYKFTASGTFTISTLKAS